MFDSSSRYYLLGNQQFVEDNKQVIVYKKRRFLPPLDTLTAVKQYTVAAGDRLDTISARLLGDPLAYWQIVDANTAMRPKTLTQISGTVLQIAMPTF